MPQGGKRMITIEDNDLPITVAEKIIRATRPFDAGPLVKSALKIATGDGFDLGTTDMFSVEEIREIAAYLNTYCEMHKDGD